MKNKFLKDLELIIILGSLLLSSSQCMREEGSDKCDCKGDGNVEVITDVEGIIHRSPLNSSIRIFPVDKPNEWGYFPCDTTMEMLSQLKQGMRVKIRGNVKGFCKYARYSSTPLDITEIEILHDEN